MRGCPACSSVVRTSIGSTASAFVARTQARVTFYHLEIAPSAELPQGAWSGALHDEAARERNSKRVRCHAGEFSLLTSSVQRPSKIEHSAGASKSAGRPFEDDSVCVTVLRRKSHGHTTGWQLLYSYAEFGISTLSGQSTFRVWLDDASRANSRRVSTSAICGTSTASTPQKIPPQSPQSSKSHMCAFLSFSRLERQRRRRLVLYYVPWQKERVAHKKLNRRFAASRSAFPRRVKTSLGASASSKSARKFSSSWDSVMVGCRYP